MMTVLKITVRKPINSIIFNLFSAKIIDRNDNDGTGDSPFTIFQISNQLLYFNQTQKTSFIMIEETINENLVEGKFEVSQRSKKILCHLLS